jgi:hypothetical protein
LALTVCQDTEAVVLDLVNSARIGGQARQAWFEAWKRLLGARATLQLTHY